jgi:hypothetical protein
LDETIGGSGFGKKTKISDERVKRSVKFFSATKMDDNPFEAYGKKLDPLSELGHSKEEHRKGIMATRITPSDIRIRNEQRRKSLISN